ncbi:hypothetical protein SPBR_04089 [Sporothrix brasiliensis 5110]|uniref:Ubiquitin-like protease family profile domain-containing protein n=1 Tax=Sporothrix brasiliensis 5110 TaxID=1398154 RepID=A0A0C2J2Q8_9PEZI|nr:uncharacterized protein SPBR_04089 [Sporothrix brasiliensis 5110]KIH93330.1 hypothetical protein SPBR_04089 [Sporothrix brasiliensis 5110]
MPKKTKAAVRNNKKGVGNFSLEHLGIFGPEAVAVAKQLQKAVHANRKNVEKELIRVLPPKFAAFVARYICGEGAGAFNFADSEIDLAIGAVSLTSVGKQWSPQLTTFYKWWTRGRHFCEELRALAAQMGWAKFASYASRAFYEEDVEGKSGSDFCLQLRHLRIIRKTQLSPLTSQDALPDDYQFDAHGLLERLNIDDKKWTVIVLSNEAPTPPDWPEETELLKLPDAGHDKNNSNFLVFPCLKSISVDPLKFCDRIRNGLICLTDVSTVVEEVKEIVEAAVLRSRHGSVKGTSTDASEDGNKTSVDNVVTKTREAAETLAGLASACSSRPSSKQNASSPDYARADETRGAGSRGNYLELVQGVPTTHDINTLDDGQWLNDAMVNFGLLTIGQQHPSNTFFFNTFLVENLLQGTSCAKWTEGVDLSAYDHIIVPVHDPRQRHWFGAVLWRSAPSTAVGNTNGFELTFFDSLSTRGHDECRVALKRYFSSFQLVDQPLARVPKQTDDWSCADHFLDSTENFVRDPAAFKRAVKEEADISSTPDTSSRRVALRRAAEEKGKTVVAAVDTVESPEETTEECTVIDMDRIPLGPVGTICPPRVVDHGVVVADAFPANETSTDNTPSIALSDGVAPSDTPANDVFSPRQKAESPSALHSTSATSSPPINQQQNQTVRDTPPTGSIGVTGATDPVLVDGTLDEWFGDFLGTYDNATPVSPSLVYCQRCSGRFDLLLIRLTTHKSLPAASEKK